LIDTFISLITLEWPYA